MKWRSIHLIEEMPAWGVAKDQEGIEWLTCEGLPVLNLRMAFARAVVRRDPAADPRLDTVIDFLGAWRYCPVSSAESPAPACLKDAARQLLVAVDEAVPLEHGLGDPEDGFPLKAHWWDKLGVRIMRAWR